MKGKLIINRSINTITLSNDIVIAPKGNIKITMEQYYSIYQSTIFKNYLSIGYIVCYDTTLPNKKENKVKDTLQDNRLNVENDNTIINDNNTTNNVYISVSEAKTVKDVIDVEKEVSKNTEEVAEVTSEPKTNTSTTSKRKGGRKRKGTSK